MNITSIDHIVLTTNDIERTLAFYTQVLGMQEISFSDNRKALLFGQQKINLHEVGKEILPNASNTNTGTLDICLLTDTPLDEVMDTLIKHNVAVLEGGIVSRTGAVGKISSIYCRDPEGNLIEISCYD